MNNFMKTMICVPTLVSIVDCTEIVFNGCSTTTSNNEYFAFTANGNDQYCITKCEVKKNPDSETVVTIKIPGKIDDNQVSLGPKAFNWNSYSSGYENLKVNLIFEKADDTYVKMPGNCSYMFQEYGNVNSLHKTTINLSGIDTTQATNMAYMFYHNYNLTSLDLSSFNTSNVKDMKYMFAYCQDLTSLDLSGFDASAVVHMSYMFSNCKKLTSLNLSGFNTNNAMDMDSMFAYCENLTSLDLSNFNTSNVTIMPNMFSNCKKLTSLNLSGFNTNNVTDMNNMFVYCENLTSLNLGSFNTSNVANMKYMFAYCSSLTSLDLSNFNTSNVTNMGSMFKNCSKLTSLDLNIFDTSNVTNMESMFKNCSKLTSLDLSNFNTNNITDMNDMFRYCRSLTSLDLTSFDTSNATNIGYMFSSCNKLTTVKVSPLFVLGSSTITTAMFDGCDKSILTVVGDFYDDSSCGFIAASDEIKNKVDSTISTLYIYASSGSFDSGLSDSLETFLSENGISTIEKMFREDISALFSSSSGDAIYIGMESADQTIIVDGDNKIIAGALINKSSDEDIGYEPSSLQLTGTIELSGDNSGFTEKSFIVGDGTKATTITLTSPKALLQTNTIIQPEGMLVFDGVRGYTITKDITIKSGGSINARKRLVLSNDSTLTSGA